MASEEVLKSCKEFARGQDAKNTIYANKTAKNFGYPFTYKYIKWVPTQQMILITERNETTVNNEVKKFFAVLFTFLRPVPRKFFA